MPAEKGIKKSYLDKQKSDKTAIIIFAQKQVFKYHEFVLCCKRYVELNIHMAYSNFWPTVLIS
jgi:hypothetical protein